MPYIYDISRLRININIFFQHIGFPVCISPLDLPTWILVPLWSLSFMLHLQLISFSFICWLCLCKWQTGVRSGLQEIFCPFWKLLVPHRVILSQLNRGLKYSLDFIRSGLILSYFFQRIGFPMCFFPLRFTDLKFDAFMISLIYATFTTHLILLYLFIMFMLSYESLCYAVCIKLYNNGVTICHPL